jgi:hypothetical protein
MITAVVAKLKTGSVTNVVPLGVSQLPSPPYVVVKPEQTTAGRRFRIIGHFLPGQQTFLEDYIRNEVPALLDGAVLTSRHGNENRLELLEEYGDLTVGNDDKTISMERCFLLPSPERTF